MKKFVFNKEKLRFDPKKLSVGRVLGITVKYLFLSLLAAVLYYVLFALVFNTDTEKRLLAENEFLVQEYETMREKIDLLDNVVSDLRLRDEDLYRTIFNSDPPQISFLRGDSSEVDLNYLDSLDEVHIVWDTYLKGVRIDNVVAHTDRWISNINTKLSEANLNPQSIPSISPISGLAPAQAGASIGQKVNPFYKTIRYHSGIDLMSPVGTEVRCTADGVVTSVTRSSKGSGNRIEIDHGNGITTSYAHLSDILIRKGQPVKQGRVIARVGISGTSFAPHLHYEVIRDGSPVDPVNYFFAELDPASYREMVAVSMNSGQSMD